MLDSILPPSIPRRPKKQSQLDLPNDLESFERPEAESDNEQIANLESLKSKETSDSIPIIPKRPDRSKSSSRSPSYPVIPKRPQKSVTPFMDVSSSLDIPGTENEQESNKRMHAESTNSKKISSDDAIESFEGIERNSEVEDRLDEVSFDEVKTRDNTNSKTTIKEDLNNADDNYMHRLNDDLETVLKKEDENHEISKDNIMHSSSDSEIKDILNEQNADFHLSGQKSCETEDNDTPKNCENDPIERETDSNRNELFERVLDKDQHDVCDMSKVKDEKKTEDKDSGNIPHIPRRPKKLKSTTHELDSNITGCDNVDNVNAIEKKEKNIEESELSSLKNETPQDSSETPQPERSIVKPKAPPKPKKLSSKIAAFQQMFNQEDALPKNLETDKSTSKPVSNAKTSENKEVPSRLSTDKVKFAQSLQGMMGKGIAMPGMVNPNFHQIMDPEEIASPNKDIRVLNVKKGIAKGPRGKKLPKSLKNPVNIEVAPRFTSFVLTIWVLDFQAHEKSYGVESNKSISSGIETQKSESKTESVKFENDSDQNMINRSNSNPSYVSKSDEEVIPLKMDHDDVHLGNHMPITTYHEQRTLKGIDNIGSIDTEFFPKELQNEFDSPTSFPVKPEDLKSDLVNEEHIIEGRKSDEEC